MPCPTSNQKKSKKAYEAKEHKHNIDANNSESENSNNFSYDEAVENNNAESIIKRFQATANNYYSNNNMLENYDNESLFAHNELIEIENDNAEGFVKKLLNTANIFYHENDSNKSRTPTLFTFWNQDKTVEEDVEAELLSEDEIENSNWHKKIKTTLENIVLDIKNENVNSEVWICLNSIRFYFQLIKHNYRKMEASKIVADAAGKEVYHARFAPLLTISLNTAKNYLKELGYVYERVKKGIYIDGHKREEVVAYRKIFLERMSKLEPRMSVFSGDNMEIPEGEQPLRKKGEGCSIHVSEFLMDVRGRLLLPEEMQLSDTLPRETCVIICSACFPRCQALFAFDNIKSYTSYASDALVAKNMNLSSASKQEKIRSISYF
ncbi:8018_t:CDS:2, partial [Scutellospora calospora]